MKKALFILAFVLTFAAAGAQTLNVTTGNVTYQFPASQTGDMIFSSGTTLTIMGKEFAASDITNAYIDGSDVTDNLVTVIYNDTSATVTVAGNIARYVTATVSGAHVSITQSEDVSGDNVGEITYSLSGSTSDGEFHLTGSYKTTVTLNGVTIVNKTPVYSGAAINVQNGKRINVSIKNGTVNTLTDCDSGSQKACLVIKGHGEFKGKGTLNIYGLLDHGIKTGEYMTVKNCTINVLAAPGDGIHCNEYFLMESGSVNVSGVTDDGIQAELDGTVSTGQTIGHEDEDSGNIYINDGADININVTALATKGIKAYGDIIISGGNINVTTTGNATWDATDSKVKASAGLSSDGKTDISGGTLTLTCSGGGAKGMSGNDMLTVTGGTIDITTTGGIAVYASRRVNNDYTGNTDRIASNKKSSPKGIKYDGNININGGTINVSVAKHEGIESKGTITITGGNVYSYSKDDAINSASTMDISGGYVCGHSTDNDGLDANGNCYIKGGVVYAIGKSAPEVAIDANTERGYKLYVQGGTIVAIGGLERGSTLTQSCYSASTWNKNTWYALYNGSDLALAFKTPASGGTQLVVSTPSTPSLKSGVTVSDGIPYWNETGNIGASISGGTTVTLSTYTGEGGGPGPGPW